MIAAVVTICSMLCRQVDVEVPTPMACAMALMGPHIQAAAADAMRPGERVIGMSCKPGKPL